MEKVYISDEFCCGCTACASICPKQAIIMKENNKGYKYPHIDQTLCVNCGLCKKVCAFANRNDSVTEFENPICYAVKNKNQDVIDQSRSGGVFTALTDYVLENGGVVYGASLEENFIVRHIKADTKEKRDKIRKSKYVQSDLSQTYKDIKEDLKSGKIVLFSGTGCQCHGLKSYINYSHVNDEKLILCDLICNGVPSPKLLKKYIEWVEEVNMDSLEDMEFRSKDKFGWETCVEKLYFKNKVIYQDYYANLYFDALNIRESCFNCPYTTIHRVSDFTLGDFWGVKEVLPDFFDKRGVSLLLVHTEKAKKCFEKITEAIDYRQVSHENVLQPRLKTPEVKASNYEKFWNDVEMYPYREIIKKYGKNSVSKLNLVKSKLIWSIKLPGRCIKKLIKICFK